MIYIYVLKLCERLYDDASWTDEDNIAVERHFHRIKEDYEKGKIIHVGRTTDPKNDGFGLVVFQADDLEEANQYMENDPAIIGGQMTGKVFEYKVVF